MLLSLSLTISIAKSCTRSMAKLLRFMSSMCVHSRIKASRQDGPAAEMLGEASAIIPQQSEDERCCKEGNDEYSNPAGKYNFQDIIFANFNFS